jgi:ABC-type bacteriocin/lantibiotic exporter with double-glycine peptidase domain
VFFTARESIPLAVFNILILTVFVSVSVYLSRKIVPLADEKNKGQALVMERFIDILTNISTVKRLGLRDWALEFLRRESTSSNRSIFSFQRFHANRWCLLHAIFHISLLLTIAFLLYQVERGQASPSILILFIAGFARVQNQAERLSEMIKGLLEANAYVARLQEIVSEQRPFGATTVSPLQEIECRVVSHRYANRSGVVSIPAFTLKAGERVLISGASGQGKSTFLSILAHHLVPSQGDCLWNGTPYSQLDESLAHAFALVSQEVELFDLSLRENLSLAASVSDEALVALLGELGLADLMRALPEGLSARVGEKGLRLSTGQKQRLNLARALLLNRPILLLDEPTAHLDKESEELVMRCLAKLPARTTVVIVSHHEALRSLCSRRFVFEGGVMRELAGG